MMTPRERFLKALRPGVPDRVPLFELEYNRESVLGIGRCLFGWAPEFKSPADCTPEENLRFERVMFDIIFELDIDSYSYLYSGNPRRLNGSPDRYRDDFGVVFVESPHGDPVPVEGAIRDPADLDGFWPRIDPDRSLPLFGDIRAALPDRALVFTVPGPFKLSWTLLGSMEKLLLAYAMKPEFALDLARRATDLIRGLIDCALDLGADAVLLDGDLAHNAGTLMSPAQYRRFVKPFQLECVAAGHAGQVPVLKHCDGDFQAILDDFLECGFDGLHPMQPGCMDILAVKQRVQGRAAVLGNIDCVKLLPSGAPEEVEAAVQKAIRALAPGGGYILSSSNSIHPGCRPDNVIAMIAAARRWGEYPHGPG